MYTKILNSKTMNEYDPAGTVIPCRVRFFWGGCGGFDGYYTGWVVMENKVFKISK